MTEIQNVTKESPKVLNQVFIYMNRTIAVRFIQNSEELEEVWSEAQFELSSKYQYEGNSSHIWDYYLVFCCNFAEDDLDKRLRFKIESDRFCCRKCFVFGLSLDSFEVENLVSILFPDIVVTKRIQIIKASTILNSFTNSLKDLVPESFFTEELDESSVEILIESLIAKGKSKNGRKARS